MFVALECEISVGAVWHAEDFTIKYNLRRKKTK